jgi:hypothetical protein
MLLGHIWLSDMPQSEGSQRKCFVLRLAYRPSVEEFAVSSDAELRVSTSAFHGQLQHGSSLAKLADLRFSCLVGCVRISDPQF